MKLPGVTYGAVQPLAKRDAAQEVGVIQSRGNLVGAGISTAYQVADAGMLVFDQRASAERGRADTETIQALDSALAQDFVDVNSLPAEVQSAIVADPTLSLFQEAGGQFQVPTDKVSEQLIKYASDRIQTGRGQLSNNRRRSLYQGIVRESINDGLSRASSRSVALQIDASRRDMMSTAETLSDLGNLDGALAIYDEMHELNLADRDTTLENYGVAYDKARTTTDYHLEQALQGAITAAMQGNPQSFSDYQDQYAEQIQGARTYGDKIYSEIEANEKIRGFIVATDKARLDNELRADYNEGGYVQAQKYVATRRNEPPPENWTQQQWNDYQGEMQSQLSKQSSADTKAVNMLEDMAGKLIGQNQLMTILNGGGVVPASGDAYKAFDENGAALIQSLDAGNDDEAMVNGLHDYFERGRRIPGSFGTWLNDGLNSRNPEVAARRAVIYATIKQRFPKLIGQTTNVENMAALEYTAQGVLSGADPDDVMRNMERIFYTEKAESKQRLAANSEFTTPDAINKEFDKFLTDRNTDVFSWFTSDPAGTAKARVSFEWSYMDALAASGDPEVAFQVAKDKTADLYAPTKTNKNYPEGRMMAMAPEKVYGEYATKQFHDYTTSELPDLLALHGENSISLDSDGLTMTQDNPSYPIMITDPNDPTVKFQAVGQDGKLLRFRPNFQITEEYGQSQLRAADQAQSTDYMHGMNLAIQNIVAAELNNGGFDPANFKWNTPYEAANIQTKDVFREFTENLKDHPYFQYEKGGRGGLKTQIFDSRLYAKTMREFHKSKDQAVLTYMQNKGLELPAHRQKDIDRGPVDRRGRRRIGGGVDI